MKLVIEHEPYQRMTTEQPMEYAVYLEGSKDYEVYPVIRFATEAEARRYCELRQRGKRIAEYDL